MEMLCPACGQEAIILWSRYRNEPLLYAVGCNQSDEDCCSGPVQTKWCATKEEAIALFLKKEYD